MKFRERYKKPEFKVDKSCRIGRNYEAYEAFMNKNPDTAVAQMDSVIGSKGGKQCISITKVATRFTNIQLSLQMLRFTLQSGISLYY